MRKLKYAYVANGDGFRCPYGMITGGSSISTQQHDVFFDPALRMVAIHWFKDPKKVFFVDPARFNCIQFDGRDDTMNVKPAPVEPAKRGPGRPRKHA